MEVCDEGSGAPGAAADLGRGAQGTVSKGWGNSYPQGRAFGWIVFGWIFGYSGSAG